MEKIVNRLINESLVNVDRYNNGGSTWLIFTETKQWVIELTKEGTLWYNYNYFKNLFNYLGVDVVENQYYITKWVEDTIINGVKDTKGNFLCIQESVEDTIINGVKYTQQSYIQLSQVVEDTIQNGVKYTLGEICEITSSVEDTIQNGVKVTNVSPTFTEYGDWLDGDERLDEIIQNGIKETNPTNFAAVEDAIQNGVKDTCHYLGTIHGQVEDVIQNGIKETKGINGVHGMNEVIQNGVKKTLSVEEGTFTSIGFGVHVEDTIQNGVKHVRAFVNKGKKVEDAIQNGVKDTKNLQWMKTTLIEDAVQNGVKHTEPGGYLGHTTIGDKVVHQFESPKQNNEVEDVIENSFKQTMNTQQKLTI